MHNNIVPPAPEYVRGYRLSSTSMFVSWNTIPLTVSRGFVQNYTVIYQSHDKQLPLNEVTVGGTQNYVLIANLQLYVVSVAATTSAGLGGASNQCSLHHQLSMMGLQYHPQLLLQ